MTAGRTRLTDDHVLVFRAGGGIYLLRESDNSVAAMSAGDLVRITRQRYDPALVETLEAMLSGDNGSELPETAQDVS